MRPLAIALALAVFVINPGFGCGEDPYQYGPEDMKRAAEGTWTIFVDGEAAPRAMFSLSHRLQAPGPRWSSVAPAGACGTRSFVSAAGACGSSSEMFFDVSDTVAATPFDLIASARLRVDGLIFKTGDLIIEFDNGVRTVVRVDPEGSVESAMLMDPQDERQRHTLHVQHLPPRP